jgi:hypothetical protein
LEPSYSSEGSSSHRRHRDVEVADFQQSEKGRRKTGEDVTFDRAGDALWRITNKAWTLLQLMERYVNAAILQRARLDEDGRLFEELMRRGPSLTRLGVTEHMAREFADVHFFIICGDKIHGLFEHIASIEHDRAIRTVWRMKKVKLEAFRDSRDVLEHMDERIARRDEPIRAVRS